LGPAKDLQQALCTEFGPKGTPAVRVYRSDPEGVTLQIRHEHEYISAWLSFADALAVADAICEVAKRARHDESEMSQQTLLTATAARSAFFFASSSRGSAQGAALGPTGTRLRGWAWKTRTQKCRRKLSP
jgi:hypothetical protein